MDDNHRMLESRISLLESRVDVAAAVKTERAKHVDLQFAAIIKRLDTMDDTSKLIVRLIIGVVISGFGAFILKGGLNFAG